MNKIACITSVLTILISCGKPATEKLVGEKDSIDLKPTEEITTAVDIFSDSYFTFLHLDSINEEMLRDNTIKKDYNYISSIKRFKKEHCQFFNTGCSNTFFDENVFLVSKQKKIGEILPVIIHDSKDFGYYHSDLYTLDKHFRKVDSIRVAISGSGTQSDEPTIYYETKVISRFADSKIITTELEYWHYTDNDSTVTMDSTIVYREIGVDGQIKTLDKKKVI
jgi:hypothetical protein